MNKHTPGPWEVGEYDDCLGYDCMTGGVRVGPVVLDGRDYGQKRCEEITIEQLGRMMADANLIAAAPELLQSSMALIEGLDSGDDARDAYAAQKKAIAKARGE